MAKKFTPKYFSFDIDEYFSSIGKEVAQGGKKLAKSGIHIKPENKGKFTASAKKAGQSVQEHAKSVLSNPNASPLQKKRANFARNAAKWHHGADGIKIPSNNQIGASDDESIMNFINDNDNFYDIKIPSQSQIDATDQEQQQNFARDNSNVNFGSNLFSTMADKPKDPNRHTWDEYALAGLSALDAALPGDNVKHQQVVRPQVGYNPNSYGTGSQAIMKAGGTVSSDKAKEILRDGTAHGHPLTPAQQRYFGFIAGGGHPKAPDGTTVPGVREDYYNSSAKLAYYKEILNKKLEAKNPQAYGDYFKGLVNLRRQGNKQGALDYIQNTEYNDYLSPQDVQSTLGEDYQDYLNSVKSVNQFEVEQGRKPLYGTLEGEKDLNSLNYGRRFASLALTPSVSSTNDTSGVTTTKDYEYDPAQKKVVVKQTQKQVAPKVMEAGGSVKKISHNPYDDGTMQFDGPSHADGGIDINYQGSQVEVEGGETASRDGAGNLTVYGNMRVPGTQKKFKTVSKEIASAEETANRQRNMGTNLVNSKDPHDAFERLAFNSGMLKAKGADNKLKNLALSKNILTTLQNDMLNLAEMHGVDPQDMSEGKAKMGKTIKNRGFYDDGGYIADDGKKIPKKPSVAERHNNPGNIKITATNKAWLQKYGAVQGEAATDSGNFAKFPSKEQGLAALKELLMKHGPEKGYKNMDVQTAISKWTGGKPYNIDLGSLKGKKVGDLNPNEFDKLVNVITQGEDSKLYSNASVDTPTTPSFTNSPIPANRASIPDSGTYTTGRPQYTDPKRPYQPLQGDISVDNRRLPSAADFNQLQLPQVASEIYDLVGNRVEPVPVQKYQPDLLQPYQVSFQDRLNENQSTFNALRQSVSDNPAALGTLAAQKYSADSNVLADQFRTNQGIANDVTNRNVGITNDAQLKNLSLADQQMVRQSQARSNTRAQRRVAFNSLSSKVLQNNLENMQIKTYEPLFDYRYTQDENGNVVGSDYYGPDANLNFNGEPIGQNGAGPATTQRQEFDSKGNLKSTVLRTDNQNKQAKDQLMIQKMNEDSLGRKVLRSGRGRRF